MTDWMHLALTVLDVRADNLFQERFGQRLAAKVALHSQKNSVKGI